MLVQCGVAKVCAAPLTLLLFSVHSCLLLECTVHQHALEIKEDAMVLSLDYLLLSPVPPATALCILLMQAVTLAPVRTDNYSH